HGTRIPWGDAPGGAWPPGVVGLPDRAGLAEPPRPTFLEGRDATVVAGPVLPQHHSRVAGAPCGSGVLRRLDARGGVGVSLGLGSRVCRGSRLVPRGAGPRDDQAALPARRVYTLPRSPAGGRFGRAA